MKRRIVAIVAAGLVFASLSAGQAVAAPDNFGQCAAVEARSFPPGPAHGEDMSLASVFNPSGEGLSCPGPNPGVD